MKNKFLYWLPVILWMAVIFFFSAQNGKQSTDTSSLPAFILERLIVIFTRGNLQAFLLEKAVFIVRKAAHLSIYAILGFLTFNALRKTLKAKMHILFLLSSAICLAYAASDEFHQLFVPSRSGSITDVFIDFSGAVTGIFAAMLIVFLVRKAKRIKFKY